MQRSRFFPRNQQVAPLQPGAVCRLPAQRAAKPSVVCLGILLPLLQQPGRTPTDGPPVPGALQMLPASTSLLTCTPETWCCCRDMDNYRTGKTRLWVPKEKKSNFCCAFKYSLAFFKRQKLLTSRVTYFSSKTLQKPGNSTY